MLRDERLVQIRELIQNKKNVKTIELAEMFNVSEMTIHRDIKPLINEGLIKKTYGGITLAANSKSQITADNNCIVCDNLINNRLSVRLILEDNTVESLCCAHCGIIRQNQLKTKVFQVITYDFLTNATICQPHIWYVKDTTIKMGCCEPQYLTFGNEEHAKGFVKGFGGTILSYPEIMDIDNKIKLNNNGCCNQEGFL